MSIITITLDRVAFATTDGPASKGKGKNKKVTWYKCKEQGHYVNECDEDVDYDDTTTKKSNKKGSNFMNQGQFSDIQEGCTECDTMDEDVDSSDDEYRFAFLQHDIICSIQDKAVIPKTWILLHSQSTVDMFSNVNLLKIFMMREET